MRTTVQLQNRSHIASLPTARLEFACAARFPAPNSPPACIALSEKFVTTRGSSKPSLLARNSRNPRGGAPNRDWPGLSRPDCGLCGNGPPAAVLAGPSRRARGGRLRGLRTGRRLQVKSRAFYCPKTTEFLGVWARVGVSMFALVRSLQELQALRSGGCMPLLLPHPRSCRCVFAPCSHCLRLTSARGPAKRLPSSRGDFMTSNSTNRRMRPFTASTMVCFSLCFTKVIPLAPISAIGNVLSCYHSADSLTLTWRRNRTTEQGPGLWPKGEASGTVRGDAGPMRVCESVCVCARALARALR